MVGGVTDGIRARSCDHRPWPMSCIAYSCLCVPLRCYLMCLCVQMCFGMEVIVSRLLCVA